MRRLRSGSHVDPGAQPKAGLEVLDRTTEHIVGLSQKSNSTLPRLQNLSRRRASDRASLLLGPVRARGMAHRPDCDTWPSWSPCDYVKERAMAKDRISVRSILCSIAVGGRSRGSPPRCSSSRVRQFPRSAVAMTFGLPSGADTSQAKDQSSSAPSVSRSKTAPVFAFGWRGTRHASRLR